jgi:triacylglycerol lipase
MLNVLKGNNMVRKSMVLLFTLILSSLSFSALASSGTPHTGYVAQQSMPAKPVRNCAWWNAVCKIKFDIEYVKYLSDRASVNAVNYNNRFNTKYPIVLVHGVSGFDQILGLVEYFQGIPAELREGGAVVYTPNVTAWDDAYVRGEQLMDFINDTVLPETGASKVHLIGHSLGSPTSRYVAGTNPEIVASMTSVNGINYGSGFADWGYDNLFGTVLEAPAVALLNLTGNLLDALAGNPEYDNEALKTIIFMRTESALAFSEDFPAGEPTEYCGQGSNFVNGVHYFSWGSTGTLTNFLDISDPVLALTGLLGEFNGEASDGLVSKCSQHWGEVITDSYSMNHLDATNMLFGLHNLLETNPKTVYENHAGRLRNLDINE